jgi:lipopolysaccharide export system protein LptC
MRDRLTQLIGIVLLAFVTATSFWYARELQRPSGVPPPAPGTPDAIARQLALTQFDEAGRAKYKLFASELKHFPDDETVTLVAPRLLSLNPEQPQFEVRAQTGRIENSGERVLLEGDVVITRAADRDSPGMRVATEHLLVLPDEDRYLTDRPIVLEHGDTRNEAQGMEIDNIARTATFTGRGRLTLAPRDARAP